MDERCRSSLDPVRLEMRVLAADSFATEWRLPGHLLATSCRGLDFLDQLVDSLAIDRRLQRSPTRKRRQSEELAIDEGPWIGEEALAPLPGLEGPRVPPAGDSGAIGEGPGAVGTGPIER